MKTKRIFIGLNNIAGLGTTLQNGFKLNGIDVDFFSSESVHHPYDYADLNTINKVPKSKNRILNKVLFILFFSKLIFKYSHFIYIQGNWSLLNKYRDIKILKFFRKKTVVIFTGCDVRLPEKAIQYNWNPCSNCPIEYQTLLNCNTSNKTTIHSLVEKNFDYIFSPDECADGLTKNYYQMWFPRIISDFKPVFPVKKKNDIIRILHAPSNNQYKGSSFIQNSINEIRKKYNHIEYIEAKGLPISKLYDLIKTCDIVIDQMLVGFYGLLSVEAMALGKPVIVYIRPDIWKKIELNCPIYNANPDTLTAVLTGIIQNPEELEHKGKQSREFVEKHHDAKSITQNMYSIITSNN